MFDLIASRGHDLGRMRPARFGGDGPGVDARHLENVLEQSRQPLDLRQDEIALFESLVARQLGLIRCCSRQRGSRSAACADRGPATRAALSSAARSDASARAAFRSSRRCARSIAIATTPASASSVPASTGRPAAARTPIGLVPTRSGTSRTDLALNGHRAVPRVGAGVGIELERGLRRRKRTGELAADRGRAPGLQLHAGPSRPRAASRWRRTRDRIGARSCAPAPTAPPGYRSSSARRGSDRRGARARRDGPRPPRSCARATADRLLATRLTARNANSATQFWGSAIVKVPTGGRKKKLRHSSAASDVPTASRRRDVAATRRTTIR